MTPTPAPVSVLVLTHNSQATLERCLRSVCWADEILVVDSGSTDATRSICEDPTAAWSPLMRWAPRAWSGFRDQRNFALKEAKHDWVFVIDSDEECSPELARRLRDVLSAAASDSSSPRAYKVRRQEYFLGRPVNYGVWNPSYQDRFFDRRGVEYINEVHEYPRFLSPPARLNEPIHHWPDFSIEPFLDKMNRYTTLEAFDRYRSGQRTHLIHLLGAGIAMFFKNYFYYSAYKDGTRGLIISLLEGVSRTVRHVKLRQLEIREKRK